MSSLRWRRRNRRWSKREKKRWKQGSTLLSSRVLFLSYCPLLCPLLCLLLFSLSSRLASCWFRSTNRECTHFHSQVLFPCLLRLPLLYVICVYLLLCYVCESEWETQLPNLSFPWWWEWVSLFFRRESCCWEDNRIHEMQWRPHLDRFSCFSSPGHPLASDAVVVERLSFLWLHLSLSLFLSLHRERRGISFPVGISSGHERSKGIQKPRKSSCSLSPVDSLIEMDWHLYLSTNSLCGKRLQ